MSDHLDREEDSGGGYKMSPATREAMRAVNGRLSHLEAAREKDETSRTNQREAITALKVDLAKMAVYAKFQIWINGAVALAFIGGIVTLAVEVVKSHVK